jgi:ATP-dependent Clp protease ATP-binding subunit ClpA
MTTVEPPYPVERFERVLAFASDEADGLGHAFVSCQHLLYALARESKGVASAVLASLGVTPEGVHAVLAESAAPHDRVEGRLDLSDEARSALARAINAAQLWSHRTLDTEHVLYGIVSAPTSADEMLVSLHVHPATVMKQLERFREAAPPPAIRDEATHAYRLTLDSAWALSLATDMARQHGADAVTSLHLLLALVSLHSPARVVLADELGIGLDALLAHAPRSVEVLSRQGRIPLSAEVQQILGYAIGEAWNRGHLAVTPLHLAMGLVRAGRSAALDALAELGVPQSELVEALAAAIPPATIR